MDKGGFYQLIEVVFDKESRKHLDERMTYKQFKAIGGGSIDYTGEFGPNHERRPSDVIDPHTLEIEASKYGGNILIDEQIYETNTTLKFEKIDDIWKLTTLDCEKTSAGIS